MRLPIVGEVDFDSAVDMVVVVAAVVRDFGEGVGVGDRKATVVTDGVVTGMNEAVVEGQWARLGCSGLW